MLHVVIYSGGMDSYTLLHKVMSEGAEGDKLVALSFHYNQRHAKELAYAQKVCNELGIEHHWIQLPFLSGMPSALTRSDMPVPEGHYEAESMKQTVVPGRNTIMLAMAMAFAQSRLPLEVPRVDPDDDWHDYDENGNKLEALVYFGAHSGDHHIYPDCRIEYADDMRCVMEEATEGRVSLRYPFIDMSKGDIAKLGVALGCDYGKSWTCYKGLDKPCGVCGSCTERAEAMAFAGIADPLIA